jgi:putative nucleotidyltransferase with HDIG domain
MKGASMLESVPRDVRAPRLSDVISALSFALDLTEGQPLGHAVRTCVIGMHLGNKLSLSPQENADLYYALLLKDSGCSNNAARISQILDNDDRRAKREMRATDWSRMSLESFEYLRRNVMPDRSLFHRAWAVLKMAVKRKEQTALLFSLKCERGAGIAREMGFSQQTADAIYSMDEHWDGSGYPRGLKRDRIPPLSRIVNLAQTLDLFLSIHGIPIAFEVVRRRSGYWFDPDMVRVADELESDRELWEELQDDGKVRDLAMHLEPPQDLVQASHTTLDAICNAFAEVVDAKSPFTFQHSHRVATTSVVIASKLGLPQETVVMIRRAALLHDIGKLSVPNTILDKPAGLTAHEWETVRLHPYYTQRILEKIDGFQELAFVASTHHERLDGSGYFRNLRGEHLPLPCRIVAIADVFDALSSSRPYRDKLPPEAVFQEISKSVPHALDLACFETLRST